MLVDRYWAFFIHRYSITSNYISSSSSSASNITGFLDSFSPSVLISHHSWQVKTTSSVRRDDPYNFLLVGQHWCVHVKELTRERHLWIRPYFTSRSHHFLFISLGWLVRWKESGRTATVVVYWYADACRTQRYNNNERHSLLEKYISHFIERVVCEKELETEQNCNILTPTLLAITAFLSRSPWLLNRGARGPASLGHVPQSSIFSPTATAQSGAWRPTLLGAGFLLHLVSNWSGLQTSLVSNWSGLQTNWLPVFTELYYSSTSPSSCGRHNCTHSTHPRSRL